ncbi:ABC transporter permease [Neomoorella glycerini]|nr:ABC transporter permease [Moorella glycerini]
MLVAILIGISAIFSALSPSFLTTVNVMNTIRQVAMISIVASAATLVMIARGLDISVGGTLALTGVIYASLATKGVPLSLALLVACLAGTMVGVINGALTVGLKINPVIATLGTMYATRGLAFLYSGGVAVVNGLPANFSNLGRGYIGPFPTPIIIMLIVFLIFHFLLNNTLLGKYTYAVGGNPETAILSGIPVAMVTFILYTLVGLMTGLSGAIMASRLGSGQPNIGMGFEFDIILAVLLGGTSLAGGEGTVLGTLIATVIVGVLANGLNLLGVHTFYQYIIKGVVLVAAVVIDMQLKGQGVIRVGKMVPAGKFKLEGGEALKEKNR